MSFQSYFLIFLELASYSGKNELNNLSLINMEYVQQVEVIKKIEAKLPQLFSLNSTKVILLCKIYLSELLYKYI